MSVETDFYTAITGNATLAAIIGTRLYPATVPDDATFPAIRYFVVDQVPSASDGCTMTRIQTDSFATSYAVVKSMRDGVIALARTKVNWQFIAGSDQYDQDGELYRQIVDLMISHEV